MIGSIFSRLSSPVYKVLQDRQQHGEAHEYRPLFTIAISIRAMSGEYISVKTAWFKRRFFRQHKAQREASEEIL
jgi:hypothetical protein